MSKLERRWTPVETAIYLGVKPKTLRNWRAAGQGPAYHKLSTGRGGSIVYDPLSVRRFLRETRVEPGEKSS